MANENDDRDIINAAAKAKGREVYIGGKLVGRWVKASPDLRLGPDARASFRQTEARGNEILVRITPFDIDDGRNLSRASSGFDGAKLAVHFSFDAVGAQKFGELTRRNLPDETINLHRHLGIVLDNTMLSAPQLNEVIHGEGQITGSFTQEDVDFLVGVLNAGSLPATLNPIPISEQRDQLATGRRHDSQRDRLDHHFHRRHLDLHGRVLSILRRRGRHRRDAQHDRHRGLDDFDQGGLHLARSGWVGADRGHGGRRERVDLRADARRDRTRRLAADGDPQRLLAGHGHDYRLARDDLDLGGGAVRRRHRPDQGLCRDLDSGLADEFVSRPCSWRA